jgi:uncharacterized membrane protein
MVEENFNHLRIYLMSFAESHFEESSVTPLIDVIQLISFPIVAFSVVTPLCMWSGYSIPVSFLMGWVFGLGAMVALIVVIYALCTVQKLRDAAQQAAQQAERSNIAVFHTYFEANRKLSMVAEWDMDALADSLDASYQRAAQS